MRYNAKVIHLYAERLEKVADAIVFSNGVLYALVAGSLAGTVGYFVAGGAEGATLIAFGALVVGYSVGAGIGERRAFLLRVQAQTLLCQAQIEENTRRGDERSQQKNVDAPRGLR